MKLTTVKTEAQYSKLAERTLIVEMTMMDDFELLNYLVLLLKESQLAKARAIAQQIYYLVEKDKVESK